jgi:hypothetical protein
MDLYHKLLTGFVILLLAGGALGAFEYVSVREEKARVEERQKADAAIMAMKDAAIKQQQDQLATATAAFEKFKQDQAAAMNAMEAGFVNAKTPDQSAALTALLLGLKVGEVKVGGTAANPTIELPIAQQQAYERTCEECKLKLTSATESLKLASQRENFLESKAAELEDKLKIVTKERDDAKKISTGGSTWTRVKHDTKAGIFGAAVQTALLALTGHLK